jgi:hypothetical protein
MFSTANGDFTHLARRWRWHSAIAARDSSDLPQDFAVLIGGPQQRAQQRAQLQALVRWEGVATTRVRSDTNEGGNSASAP